MADLTKTVEIIFGAIDNTSASLSSISTNVDKFATNTSKITAPLADVAVGVEKTVAALGALGVALVAVSANEFAKFESSVIGLEKTLDSTDPSIESFKDTARDLALQYGVTANSILDGIATFKQAGFTAEEAAKLQKNALDLVIAGDVDATRATEILVAAIKGFNIEVAQAPRFVEALNNVSNKYATDVNQLAEGMSRVAPIAKTMGFSFDETAGLLTPIIEVFRDGSVASDALKTGLLKLTDDSKPVRDALKELGVSQTDINGQMRSGRDIFYDVAAAMSNLDANQRLVLTQQLIGIEQTPKMIKVFEDLGKVQDITAASMAITGSATQEVEKRLKSLTVAANQNEQAWNLLAIAIGEKLSTGTLKSTQGLTSLGTALATAVKAGGFDPILNEINAVNLGFSQFIDKVAKALPDALKLVDFSKLINAAKDLGITFGGIFDSIDLTTPEGLSKAIQFVVDSISSLINVTDGIVTAWSPVIKAFLTGIDTFNGLDDSTKKYVGTALGISQVFESIKGAITTGATAFGAVGSALKTISETGAEVVLVRLAASLGNPVITAAAAAFGAVGFAVNANISAYEDLQKRQDTVAESTDHLATVQGVIKDRLADISARTGLTVNSMDDLNKAVDAGVIVFNDASGLYEKAGTGVKAFGDATKATALTQSEWEKSVTGVADALGLVKKETGEVTTTFESHEEAMKALLAANSDITKQWITQADGLYTLHQSQKTTTESGKALAKTAEQIAAETGKLTEKQKLAIEQTNKLELQLNELASNERIKNMEFQANIKIADIQAQAQQVVAAFDEIGVAIQATQAAQAEIFGSLVEGLTSGKLNGLDKYFLQDYALEQQRQAQQALDDQSRLIDAQVNQMNARTQALLSGGGLININADNLAPELQMVLRSLLEHIQIEANAEGLELLL
jgi:TP901 family phage tail tape measure protein